MTDHAESVLGKLVEEAASQGISVQSSVKFGKSWLEIIHRVLSHGHDLVIVGTRQLGRIKGALVGSTGMKLLRKCPCPVWITQPQPHLKIASVLVATDFSSVCDDALDLGASLAKLDDSELYVLHALDFPARSLLHSQEWTNEKIRSYRKQTKSRARQRLDDQLRRPTVQELGWKPHAHLIEGEPDAVIREQIDGLKIELLVMGTIARTGMPGMWTGNTAERLLPQIPCSVLAIKPKGFETPITLD